MKKDNLDEIIIYTDGSCNHKTKSGGTGIYIIYKDVRKSFFKGFKNTKTGRSELLGLICGMKLIKNKKIKTSIFCDSQYAIKGVNIWSKSWVEFNFAGIKNADLWRILLEEKNLFDNISFNWIKGHNNNFGNEKADKLAREGYLSKEEDKILDLETPFSTSFSEEMENYLKNLS